VEKKHATDRIRYILKCIKIEKNLLNYIAFDRNDKGSLMLNNPQPRTGWWIKWIKL